MPYAYPNNVPRVSKNWTPEQQRKCTAAANAVLNRNGSEEEAIFACIHAAGKSKRKELQKDLLAQAEDGLYTLTLETLASVLEEKQQLTTEDKEWLHDHTQQQLHALIEYVMDFYERFP